MKLNEEQLKTIIDAHEKLGIATDQAIEAGCLDPNGPLFDAIWRGISSVIDVVDNDSWISWYVYDNLMGKKGLTVTIDSKKIKVKTVKALLKIMNS